MSEISEKKTVGFLMKIQTGILQKRETLNMRWIDIQKKYPNQWVGLKNVVWKNGATIDTAEVCYTQNDISSDDMALLAIRGDIDTAKYTTPDDGMKEKKRHSREVPDVPFIFTLIDCLDRIFNPPAFRT